MITAEFSVLAARYGRIEHEGIVLALAAEADPTNRVFDGCWIDAQPGETCYVEYGAPAIDKTGQRYEVRWQFAVVKGGEPEDADGYDWSQIDRVIPA